MDNIVKSSGKQEDKSSTVAEMGDRGRNRARANRFTNGRTKDVCYLAGKGEACANKQIRH